MKINYRKKFEEAQERAATLEGRANFWEDQAGKWRKKCADFESDAKHDLIVIQTQRDALVRLRKIADLAGKQAEAIWLMSFPWARTWNGAIRVEPYFDVAMSFARDIRTALAAEEIDAQIARKSVARGNA